jgi:tRNA-dihydrouridine synthase A
VKHRIGIDKQDAYAFVCDFVGTLADAGCTVFIVHARSAWLKGLSPKENREIPPLRYDYVYRLKQDFPAATIVLNGGVVGDAQIAAHLEQVDGVMIGRDAYHHPWGMRDWDTRFFGATAPAAASRAQVEAAMVDYIGRMGLAWPQVARHMMGLWNGEAGARRWRQVWSDHRLKNEPASVVSERALAQLG